MEKINIIEEAYNHIYEALKANMDKKPENILDWTVTPTREWDAIFRIKKKTIYVIAKNEIRPNQIGQILQMREKATPLMVVANYITPTAKQLLQDNKINYADRAGNILLNIYPFHIYIEGIPNHAPAEDWKNRAFTKAGLKVVLQILMDTTLINATYRELAKKANVALGTIPKVIAGLNEEGYLLKKDDKEWLLKGYKELLDRWQEEYTKRLKPTLYIKRYRANDKNFRENWKQLALQQETVWGGEPAADILINYLKPQYFTVYTKETRQGIMQGYRWIPDEQGDIFVYHKFWDYPTDDKKGIAPLPMIYADLMETGDSRCVETANQIYEKYLRKH